MTKIKVLIVDDSALVRQTMKRVLNSDSRIEVIDVTKPKVGTKKFFEESRISICDSVVAASKVDVLFASRRSSSLIKKSNIKSNIKSFEKFSNVRFDSTKKLIAIGASTGGTEATKAVLRQIPKNSPGIVIVQHMPEFFTASYAKSLNRVCAIEVREAKDNEPVLPGTALIAPGNFHMRLFKSGLRYIVKLEQSERVNRHRPAVDVLFDSVAEHVKKDAVGCLLTGMGDDGARGLKKMHEAGAYTFAQNEETCVVFGMPKVAIDMGAADEVLPIEDMAEKIMNKIVEKIN